jgi:peptidoglycan-associated lipoprotein
MKFSRLIQIVLVSSGILILMACSSTHKNQGGTMVDEANAAYHDDQAQASGIGEEASLSSEERENNKQELSKRTYYFDFDSNIVHDEDKPAIAANANYLLTHRRAKVMVEGHTDPRGSREYNVGLGERRAKAVAELLRAKGVNPVQIRIVSYGAEKLAVPGHSEADYRQDRRVILVYSRH